MNRIRGYTLLEMLVVIALFALATSLVAPAGYRMATSWREAGRVEDALKSLARLPLIARSAGHEIEMPDPSGHGRPPPGVELPEGWRIEMDTPLLVRANGACADASGTLFTPSQTIGFRVDAPFCRVQRTGADAR